MDHLTRAQIDGIDAAIAEFGNEQTAAAEIHRHVIDAAGYIGECDCRLKFERRRPRSCIGAKRQHRPDNEDESAPSDQPTHEG
jgi:hypothetical protein